MDYYVILGVPENANPRQIKAAYRKRMKETHPDLAGWENVAEKHRREGLAKEINEAYNVLSDPQARLRYDRLRRGDPIPRPVRGVFWRIVRAGLLGIDFLLRGRKS